MKINTAFAQDAVGYFEKGMAAFNSQAYEQALEYFQKAQALKFPDKRLQYNLGVTYYKLEQYASAYEAFDKATADSQLASLSYYNKALCALKLDNPTVAVDSLQLAYNTATSDEERWLVQKRLSRLGRAPTGKLMVSATALVSVGYNDNVTLNVVEDVVQSGQADRFGAYSAKLDFGVGKHWELNSKVYGVHYQELDAYNFDNLGAALTYSAKFNPLSKPVKLSLAGMFDRSFLEGRSMLDSAGATVALRFTLLESLGAHNYLQIKYAWSDIRNIQEQFSYLRGKMKIVDVSTRLTIVKSLFQLAYQYETNRRQNYALPGAYTDFSPTRHKVAMIHNIPVMRRTAIEWSTAYRHSEYQNANQLSDSESVVRNDDRLTAAVRLLIKFSRHVWIVTAYQYLDNRSNIDSYTYTTNNYSLGVLWN